MTAPLGRTVGSAELEAAGGAAVVQDEGDVGFRPFPENCGRERPSRMTASPNGATPSSTGARDTARAPVAVRRQLEDAFDHGRPFGDEAGLAVHAFHPRGQAGRWQSPVTPRPVPPALPGRPPALRLLLRFLGRPVE